MAVKDKTVTISGSKVTVTAVWLSPQPGGGVDLKVDGYALDMAGARIALDSASMALGSPRSAAEILSVALVELRKANGLEA